MKRIAACVAIFIVVTGCVCGDTDNNNVQATECGSSAFFSDSPYNCEYLCTDKGVEFECNRSESPGCQCNFNTYLNKATKTCMEIECKNLDCVGKANQAFFTCESGSRESCGCAPFVTLDCRTGCMCKNGFCKKGDECVPRECKGGPFEP